MAGNLPLYPKRKVYNLCILPVLAQRETLEENDRETLKEVEDYTMGDGMRNSNNNNKREEYSTVDKRSHSYR